MSIHFRRKLLAFFVALFVILGIAVVYYSQGYRLDFSTFSVTKVGAVYIESYQNPTNIYLNNTYYKDKSGLLASGTLISGVIPQKYQLAIRKDGFIDYQKNIEVLPSQVTRFFNVLLIPTEIASTTQSLNASSTEIIDDLLPTAIITHKNVAKNTQWLVYSRSTDSTNATSSISTSTLITKTLPSSIRQKLKDFTFYNNSDTQFIATSSNGMLYYISVPLQASSTARVIASSTKSLYTVQNNGLLQIANQKISASTTTAHASTTQQAILIQTNIDSGATTTVPFLEKYQPSDIAFITAKNNYIAYITATGTLQLYDTNKGTETSINSHVSQALFSPDTKKLLYKTEDKKIHVYFIANELEVSDARAGDDIILSLTRISDIQSLNWYQDSNHLLLLYPDQITLAEVTKTEPNNQFPLWTGSYTLAKYFGDQNILMIAHDQNKITTIDLKLFTK
ncbi:MAG: hypothetical protein M1320_00120 [Patescibacteria group bacterium]|nr:hypothetical protein [Patescibacteria group bacterium]